MSKVPPSSNENKGINPWSDQELRFDPDNEPVWAACHWIEQAGVSGKVTQDFARQRNSAIKSLVSAFDHTPTVTEMLKGLDSEEVQNCWANKRSAADNKTIQTYSRRARFVLEEYIERSREGARYDFARLLKYSKLKSPSAKKSKPVSPAVTPPSVSSVSSMPHPEGAEISISLGSRGVALLRLPVEAGKLTAQDVASVAMQLATFLEFRTRDAGRIGAQLATVALDFDPMKAPASQMFENSASVC
jgi:hypothetical protein